MRERKVHSSFPEALAFSRERQTRQVDRRTIKLLQEAFSREDVLHVDIEQ